MERDPTIASLVIGLLVVSVVFWIIERWRPSIPTQRRTRSDTVTDIAYWFFTPPTSAGRTGDSDTSSPVRRSTGGITRPRKKASSRSVLAS